MTSQSAPSLRPLSSSELDTALALAANRQAKRIRRKGLRKAVEAGSVWAATERDGGLLAWLAAMADRPGSLTPRIEVASSWDGPGRAAASRLLANYEAEARQRSQTLRARASDSELQLQAWLELSGFREQHRVGRFVLDLADAKVEELPIPKGLEVVLLAASQVDDALAGEAADFYNVAAQGLPAYYNEPIRTMPPERMKRWLTKEPGAPLAVIFVRRGAHLVALSIFETKAGSSRLRQGITLVHPSERGQGLGGLVKARAIEAARRSGYESIETHVRLDNAPMLRINQRFGFRLKDSELRYEKRL